MTARCGAIIIPSLITSILTLPQDNEAFSALAVPRAFAPGKTRRGRFLKMKLVGRPVIEMMGLRFGRLMVTERIPNPRRNDQARWKCICDCGGEAIIHGHRLRSGGTKSCGCFRRDRAGNLFKTHGKSKTMPYCMFYDARKRAQHLCLPFDLTPEDIVIPEYCPVLGIKLSLTGHRDYRPNLDRFIPSRGYTKKNARVISFRANRIKADATVAEIRLLLVYMEDGLA